MPHVSGAQAPVRKPSTQSVGHAGHCGEAHPRKRAVRILHLIEGARGSKNEMTTLTKTKGQKLR